MESQKDNQATLIISNLTLFNNDSFSLFLYRKSQSLGAALYMVTDFFSDSEPMKWNIRKNANSLIQLSLSSAFAQKQERKVILEQILRMSLESLSFLEISTFTKQISEMNFNVLKKELENLMSFLEQQNPTFNLDLSLVLDIKDNTPSTKGAVVIKDKSPNLKGQNQKDKNGNRQSLIIKMLKEKNDQSIRNISQAFPDCSEKTIQRELAEMVENGILTKFGERRWSRYSLTDGSKNL